LASFGEATFEPVTVSIADLVTVRMDAQYQVVDVVLHDREGGDPAHVGGDDRPQLAIALREAFNEASRLVMERNAACLSDLLHKPPSEPPVDGS
jgi:hypothetical protein